MLPHWLFICFTVILPVSKIYISTLFLLSLPFQTQVLTPTHFLSVDSSSASDRTTVTPAFSYCFVVSSTLSG